MKDEGGKMKAEGCIPSYLLRLLNSFILHPFRFHPSSVILSSSSHTKEGLQNFSTLLLKHTSSHLDPMIQKISVADAKPRLDCSRSFVRRTVNQSLDPGLNQRTCAHRARFDCRIDGSVSEPVIGQLARCFSERDDFRVGGGISVGASAISCNCQQNAATDNACTDRDLATCPGIFCRCQSPPHPISVNFSARVYVANGSHNRNLFFKQHKTEL
jgi:hypothetical protein